MEDFRFSKKQSRNDVTESPLAGRNYRGNAFMPFYTFHAIYEKLVESNATSENLMGTLLMVMVS